VDVLVRNDCCGFCFNNLTGWRVFIVWSRNAFSIMNEASTIIDSYDQKLPNFALKYAQDDLEAIRTI
jgi:hypothetical protein